SRKRRSPGYTVRSMKPSKEEHTGAPPPHAPAAMLQATPNRVSKVTRTMRVDELMQPVVWDTFQEESLADAAARMPDHGVGSLAVIDDDGLVGILTERDVLRAVAENKPANVTPVSALMTQTRRHQHRDGHHHGSPPDGRA